MNYFRQTSKDTKLLYAELDPICRETSPGVKEAFWETMFPVYNFAHCQNAQRES